jgi:hypothetical protein
VGERLHLITAGGGGVQPWLRNHLNSSGIHRLNSVTDSFSIDNKLTILAYKNERISGSVCNRISGMARHRVLSVSVPSCSTMNRKIVISFVVFYENTTKTMQHQIY